MQNGGSEKSKRGGQLRSEARTSYTVKHSLAADIAAGIVSILLALLVWLTSTSAV